jgi:hypothetical protein
MTTDPTGLVVVGSTVRPAEELLTALRKVRALWMPTEFCHLYLYLYLEQ